MSLPFQTYLTLLPRATQEYPSIVTYAPLPPLLPPPSVSNHVLPSSVSINLYDTRLHLSNVSGLDRIPVQKFLIKLVLYVYRWANYNLTGLIKQHWREEAREEHVLWPSPLSPVSISTSAYLPPSPPRHICLFSTSQVLRLKGRGRGERASGGGCFGTSCSRSCIRRCRRDYLCKMLTCHYADISWYHSAYLLLVSDYWDSWTCLPACQLLQIWVIYLHSHQHLSSFRYWLMQCSRILQSIAHTVCALYLYFCAVLSGHLRTAICFMLKHDGERRPVSPEPLQLLLGLMLNIRKDEKKEDRVWQH